MGAISKFRAGLLGLLAPATMLVSDTANTYNYWNHVGLSGTTKSRAETIMAGSIISAIALYVIIILVGLADENAEKVETSGEPTGETYGGRYVPKPGTETTQYNPTFEGGAQST